MGILFTTHMGILLTITMGFLFTIVLGIQFTISNFHILKKKCGVYASLRVRSVTIFENYHVTT